LKAGARVAVFLVGIRMVRDIGFEPMTPSVSGRGILSIFVVPTGEIRFTYGEIWLL
jgi:hypothetical protein